MFGHSHTLYRPPAEADSLIIRVANGCPWNGCTFCGMYKGVTYRFHGLEQAIAEITRASRQWPDARRVFLADGDVMHLEVNVLEALLVRLNETLPRLARVGIYANGASILAKTDEQLRRLRELKLHTLYMGLESGDNQTLRQVDKRESAEEMIEAGQRVQAAGLRMSVMVLVGLAGKEGSFRHARATAEALNAMQPRLLSALRMIPIPGTPLFEKPNGSFRMLTEREAIEEIRELIQDLELDSTVFRADHSSNIVPLEARFPKDKARLIQELDDLLASGELDADSAGPLPWSL